MRQQYTGTFSWPNILIFNNIVSTKNRKKLMNLGNFLKYSFDCRKVTLDNMTASWWLSCICICLCILYVCYAIVCNVFTCLCHIALTVLVNSQRQIMLTVMPISFELNWNITPNGAANIILNSVEGDGNAALERSVGNATVSVG